jgi:VanZ family protein
MKQQPRAPFLRLFMLLFWLLLAVITALAVFPKPPAAASLGWDKLNHLAAFVGLGLLARAAWPRAGWTPWLGGLMGYGLLLELAQGLTPTRSAEAADLLADGAGLAVAALLIKGWRRARAPACRSSPAAPPR